jgi:hypothetical protein
MLYFFTPFSSLLWSGNVDLLTGTNKVVEKVKLHQPPALTNQIAWGNVSLKSLEITSDNRAVSYQLSAVR